MVLMGSVFQNVTVQNAIMVCMPDTPVAICNGYLDGPNIYGVTSDEHGGVMNAVKLLASKGRKNIAFLTNRLTPSNREKLNGYKDGMKLYVDAGTPDVVEEQSPPLVLVFSHL